MMIGEQRIVGQRRKQSVGNKVDCWWSFELEKNVQKKQQWNEVSRGLGNNLEDMDKVEKILPSIVLVHLLK